MKSYIPIIPNPPLKLPFSLGNLSPRLPVSPSPRLSLGKGITQPGFRIAQVEVDNRNADDQGVKRLSARIGNPYK